MTEFSPSLPVASIRVFSFFHVLQESGLEAEYDRRIFPVDPAHGQPGGSRPAIGPTH